MSLEHLPSAILTATLLLRLARIVRYRYLARSCEPAC